MNAYDPPRGARGGPGLARYGLLVARGHLRPARLRDPRGGRGRYDAADRGRARRCSPPPRPGCSTATAGSGRDRDILLFDPVHCYGLPGYLRSSRDLERRGWPRRAFWPHGGHLFTLHVAARLGARRRRDEPARASRPSAAWPTAPRRSRGASRRPRPRASASRRRRTWPGCFAPCWTTEETSMAYTLETFAAAAHDLLTAEPGPAGREKVRSLLEYGAEGRRLRGPAPDRRRAGAQDPLHRPAARLLHPRPQLPGRAREQAARPRADLGHLRPGPRARP